MLSKNLILNYFSVFIRLLSPLILIPLISKTVSSYEVGLYFLFISISSIVLLICEYGLSVDVIPKISKGRYLNAQVLKVESVKLVASITMCSLSIIICIGLYFCNSDLFIVFPLAVVTGSAMALYPTYLFQGKNKYNVMAYYELTASSMAVSWVFVCFKFTVGFLIIILGLTSIRVITTLLARNYWCFNNRAGFIKIMKIGIRNCKVYFSLMLSRLVGMCNTSLNSIAVIWICGAETLAVYSYAEKLVFAASSLTQPVIQVFMSHIDENNKNKSYNYLILFFLFVLLAASISSYLSGNIFSIWLGTSQNLLSSNYFSIFIYIVPIKFLVSLVALFRFHLRGESVLFSKIVIKTILVSIFMSVSMLYYVGVWGLIYSLFIVEVLILIMSICVSKRFKLIHS